MATRCRWKWFHLWQFPSANAARRLCLRKSIFQRFLQLCAIFTECFGWGHWSSFLPLQYWRWCFIGKRSRILRKFWIFRCFEVEVFFLFQQCGDRRHDNGKIALVSSSGWHICQLEWWKSTAIEAKYQSIGRWFSHRAVRQNGYNQLRGSYTTYVISACNRQYIKLSLSNYIHLELPDKR